VSKTGVVVICHTRQNNDFKRQNKGSGDFLQNKSGFSKGVSARYKTKKASKHRWFSHGGRLVLESECHIFGEA
jgi:hypothetical protein